MSILKLVIAPDDFLKKRSLDVTDFNQDLKTLVDDMFQTMYASGGIGLSAVQVGVLLRVIVIDVEHRVDDSGEILNKKQYTMINPIITSHSSDFGSLNEGCLSFPKQHVTIKRPKIINVDYFDVNKNPKSLRADGLFSICIQHEIDHLNGITISDYASKFKEEMMIKRLKKMKDKDDLK
jgi:peptide deformylase